MIKKIAVIDGMGGGIGAEIVQNLRKEFKESIEIIALGTNAIATEKMMQSKANRGATGENAIKVSINLADYILGPIGIIIPNGLMGEITPAVAEIVINARGKKILLPINQPHVKIIGIHETSLNNLIIEAISEICKDDIKKA